MKAQIIIIGYQITFVVLTAIIALSFFSEHLALKDVLYGGFISVTAAIILACRINQATKKVLEGNQKGIFYIYLAAIERLFVSIALFGIGFMWLGLTPLSMAVGLIAGQIGFSVGGYKIKD
jgi:hypothetical protein